MKFIKHFMCYAALAMALVPTVLWSKDFARQQVPGYYHLPLGKIQITALYDRSTPLPVNLFVGLDQAGAQNILHAHFVASQSGVQTAVNAYLVNTGKQLLLIDSGAASCFGAGLGSIEQNLQAAGYAAEQIDAVLLTHLHPDHACGISGQDGKKTFANATVYLSQAEADFWLNTANLSKIPTARQPLFKGTFEIIEQIVKPYQDSGQFKTYSPGAQIVEGISGVASHGHTVGHTGYLIESQQQKLMVIGDIVHNHILQFSHPDISFAYDYDAEQAIQARKLQLTQAAQQGYWVAGAHLPFPGIGHVQQLAPGSFVWLPLSFSPLVQPVGD